MKTIGIVLLILGIIGTVVFGIQALNDSESFSFLGMDIAVSSATQKKECAIAHFEYTLL